MMLENQPEEIVAQTKVESQLRSDLPVVLSVSAVIILAVVRQRDIGDEDPVCSPDVIDASGSKIRGLRGQ